MNFLNFRKIQLVVLALMVFFLPLVFWPFGAQVFELQKFALFILLDAVLVGLFAVSLLNKEIRVDLPAPVRLLFALFGGFLLIGGVASLLSVNAMDALFGSPERHFGVLTWAGLLVFAFVVYNLRLSVLELRRFVLMPLIAAGIIQVIVAVIQVIQPGIFFPGLNIESFLGRPFGTIGHPNFLGQFLLVPFFISMGYVLSGWKQKKSLFPVFLSILFLIGIFLTESRAVLIAVFWGGVFLILVSQKYLWQKHWKKFIGGCVLIGLTAFIAVLLVPADTLVPFFGDRGGSVYSRVLIWQNSLPAIADAPVLGHGFENYITAFETYAPTELSYLEGEFKIADRAHNLFLDLLATTGLLGTILFMTWLVYSFKVFGSKNQHIVSKGMDRSLMAGFLALLIAWQFSFPVIVDSVLFFLLWAILLPRKASA